MWRNTRHANKNVKTQLQSYSLGLKTSKCPLRHEIGKTDSFKLGDAGGWRDDSAVKSTSCLCKGSRFSSQLPHGDLQTSVTLVQGHILLTFTSTSCKWHIDINMENSCTHLNISLGKYTVAWYRNTSFDITHWIRRGCNSINSRPKYLSSNWNYLLTMFCSIYIILLWQNRQHDIKRNILALLWKRVK